MSVGSGGGMSGGSGRMGNFGGSSPSSDPNDPNFTGQRPPVAVLPGSDQGGSMAGYDPEKHEIINMLHVSKPI